MGVKAVAHLARRETERLQSDLSVFHQDWWIDVARRDPSYREVRVVRKGAVVGRLPFALWKNRLGLTFGRDPFWAHLGGPIVDESLSDIEKSEVLSELLQGLPRSVSFSFACDHTLSYAGLVTRAFSDAGFEHSIQVTYVRPPNVSGVLSEKKRKHRGHFKRAAKDLGCVNMSTAEFVEFYEENLRATGKRCYAPLGMLHDLIEQAINRGCGRAIAARPLLNGTSEASKCLDAAIVYIWDDRRCYYWLSTRRVATEGAKTVKPHPDAVKFLIVKAMEDAESMNLIFDADGVAAPGADHLYRRILGLRIEEQRDVFRRLSALGRLYKGFKSRFLNWRSEH